MVKVRYFFDNIIFDSSWELAFYIYLKDFGIPFEYHPDVSFPYKLDEDSDKFKKYYPDFKVHGKYIEIKSNYLAKHQDKYKLEFLDSMGVDVLYQKDIQPFLDYITEKYGKYYLERFRYEPPKDDTTC